MIDSSFYTAVLYFPNVLPEYELSAIKWDTFPKARLCVVSFPGGVCGRSFKLMQIIAHKLVVSTTPAVDLEEYRKVV